MSAEMNQANLSQLSTNYNDFHPLAIYQKFNNLGIK
ncbi:hypothetical protein SAMN05444416_11673 [Thermoactinomyces sp. DSM 45892]|nr:hypothetical protein SAMN05444416_11673 [Thermoactinomyces sp. DSM 45892]